ncbi:MAG: sensor histidine kinase [Gemmatimonadales bacterium]
MAADLSEDAFRSLVALNRAWTRQHLLRGLAHEIRNQLQVLTLGTGGGPATDAQLLPRMDQAVDRMTDALDLLSRLGRTEPDTESADLGDVLIQVGHLSDLQRNFPTRVLVIDGSADGYRVAAPSDELIQVLLNVVGAAKAGGSQGGGPIRLRVNADGATVTFAIVEPALVGWAGKAGAPRSTGDLLAEAAAPYVCRRLVERVGGRWVTDAATGELRVVLPISGPG